MRRGHGLWGGKGEPGEAGLGVWACVRARCTEDGGDEGLDLGPLVSREIEAAEAAEGLRAGLADLKKAGACV